MLHIYVNLIALRSQSGRFCTFWMMGMMLVKMPKERAAQREGWNLQGNQAGGNKIKKYHRNKQTKWKTQSSQSISRKMF